LHQRCNVGDGMNVFTEGCYKQAIRERMKELRANGKPRTLRKVAERIPVQHTYLSRILNLEGKHLNEDHLFTICNLLDFDSEEAEYLLLLRAEATTTHAARKKHLQDKLAHLREAKQLRASIQDFNSQNLSKEVGYLFDPLCVVVHVSLGIEEYRKNPDRLCAQLGITRKNLKEILRKLCDMGFIDLAENGAVSSVNRRHIHYSPQHPLMRAHQTFLRSLGISQLPKIEEEDKSSFMVTFSAEPETFQAIKDSFQKFIKEIEKKVVAAQCRNTYQLNFDLFKWV